MSQHDMVIANQGFPSTRSDLNSALAALASTSSGNSRPSTAYAQQLWVDTNTPSSTVWTLFMYDGTDDIALGHVDSTNNIFIPSGIGGGTSTIASASTVDLGSVPQSVITVSGTTTVTSFGSSMLAGQSKVVIFSGALTLTYNATSMIINSGATNVTTVAGDWALVTCISSGNYRVAYFRADDIPTTGTWTPVLTFATPGNLSVAYSTQVGTYTKIGREVTLRCVLILSSFTHTTASGNLQITGLPFTHGTVTGLASAGVVEAWAGITKANYTQISAAIVSADNKMTLTASGSGQSAATIAAADMPTGGSPQFRITITYQT